MTCKSEIFKGIFWNGTIAGGTATSTCLENSKGSTTRECLLVKGVGEWGKEVGYLDCPLDIILKLNNQMNALCGSEHVNQTNPGVLAKLVTATKVEDRPVYGHDLEMAVGIFNMTVLYNERHKQSPEKDKKAWMSYIDVASNLLDPMNAEVWQSLEKVEDAVRASWSRTRTANISVNARPRSSRINVEPAEDSADTEL